MYFNLLGLIKPVHRQFQPPPSQSLKPANLKALTTQLYVWVLLFILNVRVEYGFKSS